MSIRGRVLIENAAYHIITRGNHKKKVFYEDSDYLKFLRYVRRYKNKYDVRVYSYCLMPNHVHMLVAPKDKDKLKKVMHCLNLAYCKYFNLEHKRNGHLWQGRYKSNVILQDRYLINCAVYIEMNPVRAKLCSRAEDYKWSSYQYRVLGKKDGIIDDFII